MRISKFGSASTSLTVCILLLVFEQTYSLSMLNLKFTNHFRPNHCKARNCRTKICVQPFRHVVVPNSECIFGEGTVDWTWVEEGEPVSIKVAINNTRNSITISLETYLFNITTLERLEKDKEGQDITDLQVWKGPLPRKYTPWDDKDDLELKAECAADYYGEDCWTYCQVTEFEKRIGEFECDVNNGTKVCRKGFYGDKCDRATTCPTECINGYCTRTGECECNFGYQGDKCDRCKPSEGCANGYCERPDECKCFPGYSGPNCTHLSSVCVAKRPCLNGGVCSNQPKGGYHCECPPDFIGEQCEKRVASCADEPCQNGGKCVQPFGHPFTCKCLKGTFGRFCQVKGESCRDLPCENGAQCFEANSRVHCACPKGFRGDICDQKVLACAENSCGNGGKCVENSHKTGGIECKCPTGFFGAHCEMVIVDCRSSPCLNEGRCMRNETGYNCQCPTGFTGGYCEIRIRQVEVEHKTYLHYSVSLIITILLILALIGLLIFVIRKFLRLPAFLEELRRDATPPPPPYSEASSVGTKLLRVGGTEELKELRADELESGRNRRKRSPSNPYSSEPQEKDILYIDSEK